MWVKPSSACMHTETYNNLQMICSACALVRACVCVCSRACVCACEWGGGGCINKCRNAMGFDMT